MKPMNATQIKQMELEVSKLCRFLKVQGKAISTERAYAGWLRRFIRFVCERTWDEDVASERKLEAFLTWLAADRQVSASTQNTAFNAICYYYRQVRRTPLERVDALRSKVGERVRHAPSVEDTRKVLMAVQDSGGYPTRLICHLCYACGLRIGEATAIRLKDLDLDAGHLTICQGKGKKDRFVNLPPSIVPRLRLQMVAAEAVRQRALAMGVPVKLPNRLADKYPKAPMQRRWFWLFPMHQPCQDPRVAGRVWWHCLEGPPQSAMRSACRRAEVEGITPHHLRHAWATHARDQGARVEDIQVVLGHKDIATTLRYTHPEGERVPSPFEELRIVA